MPKRILHVANFNFFRFATSFYASDRKIQNGLIRNGHHVFEFSYREVTRWENPFRTSKFGASKMNARLLETIATYQPELILFGHSETIFPETFRLIRKRFPEIPMALWYVDSFIFPEKKQQLTERAALVDTVFTTTGGELLRSLKTPDNRVAFFPNIADPGIEKSCNFKEKKLPLDFLFCGRDYNPERTKRIRNLMAAVGQLKTETWGCLGNPPLTGQAYYDKLYQAAASLNLSHREDIPFYTSGRMTQLTGCGLLTYTPETPGMERLFSQDEVVYYKSDQDLVDKILYYAKADDERTRIAENGWRKAHTSYSPERVTRFMMETIFSEPYSASYEWLSEVI